MAHKCDACGERFSTQEELRIHGIQRHTMRFKCNVCDQSFTSEEDLQAHQRQRHARAA